MSYLPFYITPEEFEQECFKNKEKIEHTVGSMQWIAKNIEHKNRYDRKFFWLGYVALSILLIAFVTGFDIEVWTLENELGYGFIPILIIINYIYYFVFALDDRYEYSFSSEGFSYSKQLDQPKIINSIAQKVAYVACVFCVLAVIFIGPMALAGAGGSLLLAFGMTKKREHHVETATIPADQFISARYNIKRNVICLYVKLDICKPSQEPNKVWRVYTRREYFIFGENETQLKKSLQILENNIGIKCEEVSDLDLIFDYKKRPDEVKSIRIIKETFSVEDVKNKHGFPPPERKNRSKTAA
ncbi:hypothetical protein [Aliivibrio salmonicida]|uniref:hypothetical protein n=1 Tax=Aliivibrio salmonicida TaxID=40269 RepID=UPI003D101EDD